MRDQKYVIFLLFFLVLSSRLGAQELLKDGSYQLGVAYGVTYAGQNIGPLTYGEVSLQRPLVSHLEWLSDFILPKLEVNMGVLSASGGKGHLFGIGPKLDLVLLNNVVLAGAFRVVYLDEFKLRSADSLHMRHYGGHRQFQYYWDLMYRPSDSISIGYRWLHMSNGMQILPGNLKYDHNPVIETHNLVLKFPF
jgi:hypothetical protein